MMRESERAAELLGVTAPIRIDVRRYRDSPDSSFALFDVNMKPVCCHDEGRLRHAVLFLRLMLSTEHDWPWQAWP